MKNIILIGMPGCGKSTLGVILAKSLGTHFIDTDLIIQQQQKKLLQDIVNENGLDYFVKVEDRALLSVEFENATIATGGSAIFCEQGMEHLKENGVVVYLDVSCKELKRRIRNIKTRGIAAKKGQTIEDIYEIRKPFYEKYADITVNMDNMTAEDGVDKIVDYLKKNKLN